jgi:UDP-N-acetylmuramate--alanine ligase
MDLTQLKSRRVHFIGLGGAGMSGIARIMISLGIEVSGSDAKESAVLTGLQTLGARICVGHDAGNLKDADLLVVSSAINHSNPELVAAKSAGLEILSRAQALALLMSESKSVAVAGTHGKTTTTSMLTVALQRAGLDPSFAIGGMINRAGTNAHLGTGDIFVAEADESDGSFLEYRPLGAIITNLELDHVDHFPDLQAVSDLFLEFVKSIKTGGFLVAGIDSPGVVDLLKRVSELNRPDIKVLTYGNQTSNSDFALSHISLNAKGGHARVARLGKVLGELTLSIPGEHNLFNATASLIAGIELGANTSELLAGLESFSGARRRFETRGVVNGISVIDDYGHHPTEVRVTLETARRFAGSGRVIVIFQPHRYSRTQMFAEGFAKALSLADQVYLLEVYAASEQSIPGVSSLLISRNMSPEKAKYEPSMLQIVEDIASDVSKGDVIITLGAGDVNSLAPVLLEMLEERFA